MCDFDPGTHAVIYIQFCSIKLDVTPVRCLIILQSISDGELSRNRDLMVIEVSAKLAGSHHHSVGHLLNDDITCPSP